MKKILLLIDMQNGFLQNRNTKECCKRVESLLEKNLFDVVIATRFINCDNCAYERLLDWDACKTKEEQTIPTSIKKTITDIQDKYIYNCVNPNFLQRLAQINDGVLPNTIYLAGVDTDRCVLVSATTLFEHNIRPVVLERYCASSGGEIYHQAGLFCLSRLIGEDQLYFKEITAQKEFEDI